MSATAAAKPVSVQRKRKEAMLESFVSMCANAEGMIVADYSGITVADLSRLRQVAKEAGGEVRVVKNTVAKKAIAEDKRFAPLVDDLRGQLIYGVGSSAPAIAKAMRNFAKDCENLQFRAGAMDGALLDPAAIDKLADLPSREEMLGILAGTLNAPIVKLARTLAEMPASLARAVGAVRDSKAGQQ